MSAETVRLEVGAPAHGGHCVARHDGRVVFVRHAIPGEVVDAVLTDAEPDAKFWRGETVNVVEASPDRVESAWPAAGPGGVGGGELAHVRLAAQRDWKLTVLREAFERFARTEFTGGVAAAPGDDDRGGLRYRTRLTATAGPDGRPCMTKFRSHDLVPLDDMPLAVEEAEEALLAGRYPQGSTVSVAAPAGADARVLVDGKPWRKGGPDKRDNAPATVRETVTVGEKSYEYRVATGGFWQVHVAAPSVLVREVLDRVGDAERVLDLYAGAGLFTLPLAAGGRTVVSVEADDVAARNAVRNLHGYDEVDIFSGDVRRALKEGLGTFNAVVLDPPRSGAGKFTLEQVATTGAQRLVYVACDPVALARDVAYLDDLGYALDSVEGHDLFPMTHHVEAVASFSLR